MFHQKNDERYMEAREVGVVRVPFGISVPHHLLPQVHMQIPGREPSTIRPERRLHVIVNTLGLHFLQSHLLQHDSTAPCSPEHLDLVCHKR